MNILFTICGRAGSKGFKNKNIKELRGVPLVFYTLAIIKEYINRHPQDAVEIALNTDSDSLIALLRRQKALYIHYIERKDELAGDLVPKVDVIKNTYLCFGNVNIDVIIDLDITSPLRRLEDIENVLEEYNKGIYDLVFSVVAARRSPYFNMVEGKSDGYYRKICESNYTARQQTPKTYEMNASIYAYSPQFLCGQISKSILEYNCGISMMPDYLVLDIDSEEDFQLMQYLHSYYCLNDIGLNKLYLMAKDMDNNE